MKTNPLGRTGLSVSKLTLGGAAIGRQYGPVAPAEVQALVECALNAGVNLIDTSAYYGEGESEQLLGDVLARNGLRDRTAICTKAGRIAKERFDFSAKGMRASLEDSLRRLKTDHVEILLAHDVEYAEDLEHVFTETADVLHQLKSEGKVKFIGMSGLPIPVLNRAMVRCDLDVVISYCRYTLFDDALLTDLLPTAEAQGVGVMNASPLSMGLLSPGGPPPWHPAPPEVHAACRAANDLCLARGENLAELAMQFCFAQDRIPTTITGTAKVLEFEANLAAMAKPIGLDLLRDVQAVLTPIRNRSWPSGRHGRGD